MLIWRSVKSRNSLNFPHVEQAHAIAHWLIIPCPQNANILGIGDDKDIEIKYELVVVDFVLMTTQNASRSFMRRQKRVQ